MRNQQKGRSRRRRHKNSTGIVLLGGVFLLLLIVCLARFLPRREEALAFSSVEASAELPLQTAALPETTAELPSSDSAARTEAEGTAAPQALENLALYHEENADIAGWLTLDGTRIDYPVMYTPDDPEKYLHLDFEGNYDVGGLPFIDASCSLEPESDNLLIYGHNMKNGTMFGELTLYETKDYWKEHPVISFTTLSGEREYEILAAFYDRVYYTYEECFRFYRFIDPASEAEFDEGIRYFKENALYDTGVTAEYGDRLITLVTCAYHVENGRFVVVARETP